jgi:hypothetical protein
MPSRPTESIRRAARWFLPAAALALAPKCLLCAFAYAGLGAAIGLGGPEICGAPAGTPASWVSSLAWLGVTGGIGTFGFLASRRRVRPAPIQPQLNPRLQKTIRLPEPQIQRES